MPGFDVAIVGAGSAGCVLANRLSADPGRRVLLVEAGHRVTDPDVARPDSWPLLPGRDHDWAYATVPQPGLAGRAMPWPHGRGLGGSSNLHAMAHMRGSAADYDSWAQASGQERWSWSRLLPYLRSLERFTRPTPDSRPELHGTAGPLPVLLPGPDLVSPLVADYLAAWESLGLARIEDHNHGSLIGASPNALTIEQGRRVTAADAYLTPAAGRPNLEVRTDTLVHRVVFSRQAARGIEVGAAGGQAGGTPAVVEADAVILAAGALGDPLLLMRSGVGDPETLAAAGVPVRHALSGVGRNLHDHLLGAGNLYRARRPIPPSRLQLSESMTYLPADGPGGTAGPGGPGPAELVVGCVTVPSVSDGLQADVPRFAPGEAYTLLFGVTHPTSRGTVRITGPTVADPPVIDPAYLTTDHDRLLFRRALELARQVGHSRALDPWRAAEVLPERLDGPAAVDRFIARAAITHHHPVGTCRMGPGRDAVVDGHLRVHGLRGLHVVDAAVFPTITTGPIHASVLAVAESFAALFTGTAR